MNEFIAAADDGRIAMNEMEWAHKILLGFKYTTNTVYSEDWDNVSLHARGIVFDYATIADYYAHQPGEMQKVMEKRAYK